MNTLAKDLHDSVGQYLAAAKILAQSSLKDIREGDGPGAEEALASLVGILQECLDSVRDIEARLRYTDRP